MPAMTFIGLGGIFAAGHCWPRMRISIITPSFNQRPFLEQTLRSVLFQSGNLDLAWIVIDGNSTDGSVELLQSITDPRVRWISEPDRGQSNAVNKGLRMADGDIIGWLNSDDLYAPGRWLPPPLFSLILRLSG